jgi:hypothetical protein
LVSRTVRDAGSNATTQSASGLKPMVSERAAIPAVTSRRCAPSWAIRSRPPCSAGATSFANSWKLSTTASSVPYTSRWSASTDEIDATSGR